MVFLLSCWHAFVLGLFLTWSLLMINIMYESHCKTFSWFDFAETAADVLLWRNKKISGGALGVATVLWILFDLLEYHLLTLVCHGIILTLAIVFLWSNAMTFIHKWVFGAYIFILGPVNWLRSHLELTLPAYFFRSPPHIPEVSIPEKPLLEFASVLRYEIYQVLYVLREIASGRDLKKFIGVCWILDSQLIASPQRNPQAKFHMLNILAHEH